jgi:hypothetical protein
MIFLGRVIRVMRIATDISLKKYYLKFWVPDNLGLGSGIPDLPEFTKNNKIHKFWYQFIHSFTKKLCRVLTTICRE